MMWYVGGLSPEGAQVGDFHPGVQLYPKATSVNKYSNNGNFNTSENKSDNYLYLNLGIIKDSRKRFRPKYTQLSIVHIT